MTIQSDLSRQQVMTERRIGATGTFNALRYDLSKQRCMKQQRSKTSNTCMWITIRFVLLAVSFLQYDLICPNSNFWHIGALKQLARLYALRNNLSCC